MKALSIIENKHDVCFCASFIIYHKTKVYKGKIYLPGLDMFHNYPTLKQVRIKGKWFRSNISYTKYMFRIF